MTRFAVPLHTVLTAVLSPEQVRNTINLQEFLRSNENFNTYNVYVDQQWIGTARIDDNNMTRCKHVIARRLQVREDFLELTAVPLH